MEDEDDLEVIRLKKLLDDRILQVEKENMEMLKSPNKVEENIPHAVRRNNKYCPHVQTLPPVKENGSNVSSRDTHSQIHFLEDLQSTLLSPFYSKRKNFVERSRNRYIPCAVPLSPPIRIKKDVYTENVDSAVPLSPPIRNKNDVSRENMDSAVLFSPPVKLKKGISHDVSNVTHDTENQSHANASPRQTCNKFVRHPSYNKSLSIHTCNKSSKKDFTVIEKSFPSSSENNTIGRFSPSFDGKESKVKNPFLDTSFIYKSKVSPSQSSFNSNFFCNERLNHEEQVSDSKLEEDIPKNIEEKNGLHFQIALDSCSTKDVLNTVLHKIPGIVDKLRASSDSLSTNHPHVPEQREQEVQHFHTSVSGSNHNNIPEVTILEKRKQTMSSFTQTVFENLSNVTKFNKMSEKENEIVSSSSQTDQMKAELSMNKSELNHLVKDIILETLQNMQLHERLSLNTQKPSSCQKIDSGIQSEAENEFLDLGRDHKMEFQTKDHTLNQNISPFRDNSILSKAVQVDLNSNQVIKEKHHKSCNTENPSSTCESLAIDNFPDCNKRPDWGDVTSRSTSPVQESANKIESMLEKIYEHICQEKEVSRDFSEAPVNSSILTRDVAVQFNPLHTCTKSTLTSEVKKIDSSSQYDIESKTDQIQKSNVDAAVQCVTESYNQQHLLINTYTQCEQISFIDSTVQTDLFLNAEHSATNTSVSSTPVSDSMFMDDLLSEGEISLPWNLRLLSYPGGNLNVNNTDSSDTSIKEKDYSLSEGEIPPNIIQYFSTCHFNHSEDNDPQNDTHSKSFATDAKNQNVSLGDIDKPGQSTPHGKHLRLNISSSSLSEGECNSNTSLSLGEISPGFRTSFVDSPIKTEINPSIRNAFCRDKFMSEQYSPASSAQISDTSGHSLISNYPETELLKSNLDDQTDVQNASRILLQTVDEEFGHFPLCCYKIIGACIWIV